VLDDSTSPRGCTSAGPRIQKSQPGAAVNADVLGNPPDGLLYAVPASSGVPRVRLLLVDDEPELVQAVAGALRLDGYAVDVAHDGWSALERIAQSRYSLVCLDVTMPGIDGFEVCRRLRADRSLTVQPRVLMLTGRDSLADRVAGLDNGADDYLVKPFALPELKARVRSLLRQDLNPSNAIIRAGDLRLDVARHAAARGKRALDLTPKEFGVLRYLMNNAGRTVPKAELLAHVWDAHATPDTDTVRVTVGTLRKKLASDNETNKIDTVVGHGYCLRDDHSDPLPDSK